MRLTIQIKTVGDGEYNPVAEAHCPELGVTGQAEKPEEAISEMKTCAYATARYVLAHPTDPRSPARKSAAEYLLEHGDDAFEVIDLDSPIEPTEPGPEPGPQETQETDSPWVP